MRKVPRLKWHMLRRRQSDQAFSRTNLAAGLVAGASLEVDIVATADGDFVCLHDLTLDRETTGTGPVAAATRDELMALRQRNSDGAALDEPPLFLSEVVEAAASTDRHSGGRIQLDLKQSSAAFGSELIHALRNQLAECVPRFIATSCEWELLERLRLEAPEVALGFDPMEHYDDGGPDSDSELEALAETTLRLAPDVHVYYVEADVVLKGLKFGVNLIERLGRSGSEVDVWTIDADRPDLTRDLQRLIQAGCHQITTNDPDILAVILQESV
jgi:glycerophosphoryl diester phosphodiesterase